jgi:hypothetical protein
VEKAKQRVEALGVKLKPGWDDMEITKSDLEQRGFIYKEESGLKWYEKQIARKTYFRFGYQFNGACELVFPDGNDGEITLVPNFDSWEDLDTMARLFTNIWIDCGHTLTTNAEDEGEG